MGFTQTNIAAPDFHLSISTCRQKIQCMYPWQVQFCWVDPLSPVWCLRSITTLHSVGCQHVGLTFVNFVSCSCWNNVKSGSQLPPQYLSQPLSFPSLFIPSLTLPWASWTPPNETASRDIRAFFMTFQKGVKSWACFCSLSPASQERTPVKPP